MKLRFGLRHAVGTILPAVRDHARLVFGCLLLAGIGLVLATGNSALLADALGVGIADYGPSGPLRSLADAHTIHVTFDRPMVPEELPGDTVTSPMRITPALAGRFWWSGTRTLVFVADHTLPLATRFEVVVPAGLRALDGTPLKREYRFSFETPRLGVLRFDPAGPPTDLGPGDTIAIVFSQAVAPTAVRNRLTALAGNRAVAVTCRAPRADEVTNRWANLSPDQIVIVAPARPWPVGAALRLTIGRALTGREGTLGMARDQVWSGRSAGQLRFEGFADNAAAHPLGYLRLKFSSRVRPADVVSALRLHPVVTLPQFGTEDNRPTMSVYLPLNLKPGQNYRYEIGNQLRSIHGHALAAPVKGELRVRDLPPALELREGYLTLRPDQVSQFAVTVTNLDALALRLAKVTPEVFLDLDSVAWQVNRQWSIASARNVPTRKLVPVAEVLPAGARGLVRAQFHAPGEEHPREVFLQVTTLGVTGKFSPETTLLWVTKLQGGAGVAGAEVALCAPGKGVLWRGRTDAAGLVTAPGWTHLQLERGEWTSELFAIVTKDGEQAVLSSRWDEGVEAWRFPIGHESGGDGRELRGELFSDRGIYRPGESVRLKGIVRLTGPDGFTVPKPSRVEVRLYNPEGNEVHHGTYELNRRGGFDLAWRVPGNAPLGNYWIEAILREQLPAEDGEWYNAVGHVSGGFRVAEFRPAGIKATVTLPSARLHFGEEARALIAGRALAGTPLAHRATSVWARLEASPPQPAGWDEFSFSPLALADGAEPEEDGGDYSMLLLEREGELDGNGELSVAVSPPAQGYRRGREAPANQTDGRLAVEATVRDLSDQVTAGRATVPILRSDLMVGVRIPENFRAVGESTRLEAIVLDRNEKAVSDRAIEYTVVRRTWVSERRRRDNDEIWVSRAADEVVATGTVTSGATPVGWTVNPAAGGYYLVAATVRDDRGRAIQAAQSFYVWGAGGEWWRPNDDRVDLVADRAAYRPGETAKIIIRSPFTRARALVTTEREGVLTRRIVEVEGTTPRLEVPLTAEHVPNIYVGVVLINTAPDFREGTPVRLGLINLPVDPAERRLAVAVAPARPEYEPGDSVTVTLTVRDAAGRPAGGELTVAVVDEGVIQLVEHRFPDLMGTFFAPWRHHVTTADLRTHLVDDRTLGKKGEAAAGDGGGEEDLGSAAWLRRNFDPTAAWFPAVTLNERGEATITFTLPDAITTYRILVVANGDGDRFGRNNETTFLARRKLALEPVFPRFVRPGDDFFAGVLVRNLAAAGDGIDLRCEATGVELMGETTVFARVPRGGDQLVRWQYRVAPDATGPVVVRFYGRARGTAAGDAVERTIPVVRPRPEPLFATAGNLAGGQQTEAVLFPPGTRPEAGGLELQLSTTALVQLAGATEYLFAYPYGCLEQRTSRVVPILELGDAAADLGLKGLPGGRDEIRKIVNDYLQMVPLFQNQDGGYGIWQGGGWSYPHLTALVVKTMARARARGYAVDERSLAAATDYLTRQVKGRDGRAELPYNLRCRRAADAWALAALAEAGAARPADLEPVFRDRDQLPLTGVAALYSAAVLARADVGMRAQLRRIMLNALRLSPSTAHFEEADPAGLEWIYHSDVTTTAAVLEALLADTTPFPHADKVTRWLATERRQGRWRSTRENAAVTAALGAYYRRYEPEVPDLTATVRVTGQAELTSRFRGRSTEVRRFEHTMRELLAANAGPTLPIGLDSRGPGRLYYELRLAGLAPESASALDRGFAVERSLETLAGEPVNPARARRGETYRLRCVITTHERRLFVVADVPLPAGFEGIDLALATERSDLARHLEAVERRWWWDGFGRTEIRDDRVLFFADQLPPGRHEVAALVRVTAAGAFAWPAARAEAMYEPEVFGRSAAATVAVAR